MAQNRGKQFEDKFKESWEKLSNATIDRVHDQTTGFAGSKNICDFIAYSYPNIFYLELKSCHGNTFPLSNLTDNQFNGLLEKSYVPGVIAGVIVWWIDRDTTIFFPITYIQKLKEDGYKSIHHSIEKGTKLLGKKKRIFFDYDIKQFLEEVQNG